MKSLTILLTLSLTAALHGQPTLVNSEQLAGKLDNTNAAVNAAIATNTDASRDSLRDLNRDSLYGLANCVYAASTTGDFPVSQILLGDSFTDFFLTKGMRVVGSYKTSQVSGGGDSGVTEVTGDYTKAPNGRYWSIASGGNLTCGHLVTAQPGPASHIYYTLFPGTGSAQVQFNDGSGWYSIGSAIDTSAIAANSAQVGSVSIGFAIKAVKGRIVASGGVVNGWIGQGLSGPGLTSMNFATDGQQLENVCAVDELTWKAMVAGYKQTGGGQVISCSFLDARYATVGTTQWPKGTDHLAVGSTLDTFHTWAKAANSTCDWMVIGPHNIDPDANDPADAMIDALYTADGIGQSSQERAVEDFSNGLRDWCVRNHEGYVDCRELFPDYDAAYAAGFYDDDRHLNDKGSAYKQAWVWANSNLGWLFGREGYRSSIRLGNACLTGAINRVTNAGMIGAMDAAQTSHVPLIGSEFILADGAVPEGRGISLYWISQYVAAIGYRQAGAYTPYVDFMVGGVRPSTVAGSLLGDSSKPWERLYIDKTIVSPGTTTAPTINKTAGRVNLAAAASSLVVTSSKITANSIIMATVATNDATMKSVSVVAAAGSFTLYPNAAPTAETAVNWFAIN